MTECEFVEEKIVTKFRVSKMYKNRVVLSGVGEGINDRQVGAD